MPTRFILNDNNDFKIENATTAVVNVIAIPKQVRYMGCSRTRGLSPLPVLHQIETAIVRWNPGRQGVAPLQASVASINQNSGMADRNQKKQTGINV
jgi:hypothetical protein